MPGLVPRLHALTEHRRERPGGPPRGRYWRHSYRSQQGLDFSCQFFRSCSRRMARDHLARTIDQEFGEIPFDRWTEQPRFLTLQIIKQRMCLAAIDVDLGKQRKGDGIVGRANLLDLFGVAGLLTAELVAGKSENREAARVKRLVQRLETAVLRRGPASARGVDDQQNLTLEPLQRNVLAGKRLGLEIVNTSHPGPSP